MKLLTEIFSDTGLNLAGRTLERQSAKAIIRDGCKLLMIYSPQEGGYKFPGGGVEAGETDEQTLAREIQEECGRQLRRVVGEFGRVVEYKRPFEVDYDVFKMTSRYYLCQVADSVGDLRLDPYEEQLGFHPICVEIEVALRANRGMLHLRAADAPDWIRREMFILEWIRNNL